MIKNNVILKKNLTKLSLPLTRMHCYLNAQYHKALQYYRMTKCQGGVKYSTFINY